MKLSVLMPIYNERATLDDILDRVLGVQLPDGLTLEVVAVDDASTDGSWEIAQSRAAADPRVRVFRLERNTGKGAAVRRAVTEASGELAIVQDADLEYNPADYPRVLAPILNGDADAVYGSRFATAEYRRVLFFWHSVANRALTGLSNMLTDLNLTDMETCYKAFRMDILKTMPLRSNRFGIEPEITAKLSKRRLRIYEVPIRYSGRTYMEGKKIGLKDAFEALWVILKFFIVDDLYIGRYGEETLRSMELANRFTEWMMTRLRPHISGTVLEVGSGIGNNVRDLLDQEHIIATDPDPEYVRLLTRAFAGRRRVEIMHWDATQPPPREIPPVDTILCSNVLEHIENESAALQNMRGLLKPGGKLILVVPAGETLYGSLDEALEHFRRYDMNTFGPRLADAGLSLDTQFTMNRIGVPGWLLNGKLLKRKALGRYQLKLFNTLMPIIRRVDGLLPWQGLSLVVIAARKEAP
ncbi:MAG: glycosyltransferase [Lentisphaerae bacterium]|nr:glycosyltransferase [Lentisphaerota bacterium]